MTASIPAVYAPVAAAAAAVAANLVAGFEAVGAEVTPFPVAYGRVSGRALVEGVSVDWMARERNGVVIVMVTTANAVFVIEGLAVKTVERGGALSEVELSAAVFAAEQTGLLDEDAVIWLIRDLTV